jgi:TatD DNase family protein
VSTLARPATVPREPLVDIGVNLTAEAFAEDRDAVIARAREQGVLRQLVTGTDLAHSEAAIALARAHPGELFATAGVHPHDAARVPPDWLTRLEALARAPEVRALGETGLDFARNYSPPRDQERAFLAQLDLALSLGLPLFLHERDTEGRLLELLATRPGPLRGVVHCFTADAAALERTLELGLHVGITGWICDERRGEGLQRLVREIPAERLLLETDAPYLLPRTLRPKPRSRRNEPGWLPWVVDQLARCRDEDPREVARTSTANACALFDLPAP